MKKIIGIVIFILIMFAAAGHFYMNNSDDLVLKEGVTNIVDCTLPASNDGRSGAPGHCFEVTEELYERERVYFDRKDLPLIVSLTDLQIQDKVTELQRDHLDIYDEIYSGEANIYRGTDLVTRVFALDFCLTESSDDYEINKCLNDYGATNANRIVRTIMQLAYCTELSDKEEKGTLQPGSQEIYFYETSCK